MDFINSIISAPFICIGWLIVGMLAGALAGFALGKKWGWDPNAGAVLFGAVLMAAAFILVRLSELRRRKEGGQEIIIVRIVNKAE